MEFPVDGMKKEKDSDLKNRTEMRNGIHSVLPDATPGLLRLLEVEGKIVLLS